MKLNKFAILAPKIDQKNSNEDQIVIIYEGVVRYDDSKPYDAFHMVKRLSIPPAYRSEIKPDMEVVTCKTNRGQFVIALNGLGIISTPLLKHSYLDRLKIACELYIKYGIKTPIDLILK